MANKNKIINSDIWNDEFFMELSTEGKLLFMYLITNERNNLMGIYKISKKTICFDTGITAKKLDSLLSEFQLIKEPFEMVNKPFETVNEPLKEIVQVNKILYVDGYIVIPNFIKFQRYNKNMRLGTEKLFTQLPESIVNLILAGNGYDGWASIVKGLKSLANRIVQVPAKPDTKLEVDIDGRIIEEEIELKEKEKEKKENKEKRTKKENKEKKDKEKEIYKEKEKEKKPTEKNLSTNQQNFEAEERKSSEKKKENDIYRKFDHLSITNSEFNEILEKGYTKAEVDRKIDDLQNYRKNKNYKTIKLTVIKWLELEKQRQTNGIKPITNKFGDE